MPFVCLETCLFYTLGSFTHQENPFYFLLLRILRVYAQRRQTRQKLKQKERSHPQSESKSFWVEYMVRIALQKLQETLQFKSFEKEQSISQKFSPEQSLAFLQQSQRFSELFTQQVIKLLLFLQFSFSESFSLSKEKWKINQFKNPDSRVKWGDFLVY